MAGEQIKLGLLIQAEGSQATVAQLLAVQKAAAQIAQEAPGIARLSQAFGISGEGAKKLQASIGKTPDQILAIAQSLKDMQAAGVSSKQQLISLAAQFDLTAKQARQMQGAVKGSLKGAQPPPAVAEGIGGLAFKFNNVISAVQNLAAAAKPAYDFLIGSNEKLAQSVLQSQANIASSSRISKGGVEVTDPTEKILATGPKLKAALLQVEKDTQSLVGVTTSDVNNAFQLVLANANELNNQSKKFPDSIAAATSVTKGFVATMQTLNIPLDQARQEVNSILKGQISGDSTIAHSLGITQNNVKEWKAQGILVDQLNKKFEVYVAANALAAKSVGGVSSNIKDLFERVGRNAGEPLLEPLVDGLIKFEGFLKANEETLTSFFRGISTQAVAIGGQIAEALAPAIGAFLQLAAGLEPLAQNMVALLGAAAVEVGQAISAIAPIIAKVVEAGQGLLKTFTDILLAKRALDSRNALDEYTKGSDALAQQALKTGEALKALNAAQKSGTPLTKEQREEQKKLQASAGSTVVAINDQIKSLKALNAVGNSKERDAQIGSLERLKNALTNSTGDVQLQALALKELGTEQEQLGKKAEQLGAQIKSGASGDQTQFKEAVENLLKVTEDQIALGAISAEEGQKRLAEIKNNASVEVDTKLKLKGAIAKIRKEQGDLEIATLQTASSATEALISSGQLSEIEGDKKLTELKEAEIQKRIELARAAAQDATGPERKKLLNEAEKLEADLTKVKAEGAAKQSKLQLEAIDRYTAEAQAKLTLAESGRNADIQRLVNSQSITAEKADELRSNSTKERLQQEYDLAKEQAAKLAALPSPDNPQARRELEAKKREGKKREADLTLQLLEQEAKNQERLRQVAIKAIEDQTAAKTRALDKELQQIEAIKGARDRAAKSAEAASQREAAALDIATKALERQGNLLGARDKLQRAQSEAITTNTDLQIAAVDQQLKANQNDAGLLAKKAALETTLAQQKRQALLLEQATAKASLELEIRRNDIAARRQLIEAQIAEAKAKQAVLDAQSALQAQRVNDQKAITQAAGDLEKAQKLAPGRERDRAIAEAQGKLSSTQASATQNQANAQQGVELAQQGVGLASENTKAAKEQVGNQQQVDALQKQTLAIEQQTAIKRFDATEQLRKQAVEQERITAAAQAEADARERAAKAGGAAPLPQRFLGGPVSPSQPFVGAEQGAEAVRYGDGSYGLLPTPGIYQVPRSGVVLTAKQTAALMGGSSGVSLPKGVAKSNGGDLIGEVQTLRGELAKIGGTTNNEFKIVADEDPYQRMAQIAATVNRARWR